MSQGKIALQRLGASAVCMMLVACGVSTTGNGVSIYGADIQFDALLTPSDIATAAPDAKVAADAAPLDQLAQPDAPKPGALQDNGDGTVTDVGTGLMWQKKSTILYIKQPAAHAACKGLTIGGHTDWRVPTIGELRTLVLGCAATVSAGSCEVTEFCDCWSSACAGCGDVQGPGTQGCYLDPLFEGNCAYYWSSSPVVTNPGYTWGLTFRSGKVVGHDQVESNPLRCVR